MIAQTGIAELDNALKGGLPRARGYMVTGGIYSDKHIFAQHIQYESLKRGESGVYIAFTKPYKQIVADFMVRNMDVVSYMRNQRFGIIDCFSLQYGYEGEIRAEIPQDIANSICFLPNSLCLDELFEADKGMRERFGYLGVTIIDSLSDHLVAADRAGIDPAKIIEHHRRCKHYFAGKGKGIGIHIFDSELNRRKFMEYNDFIHELEDGTIYLNGSIKLGEVADRELFGHIKSLGIAIPRMRFEVTHDAITILEPIKKDPTAHGRPDVRDGAQGIGNINIGSVHGNVGNFNHSQFLSEQYVVVKNNDIDSLIQFLKSKKIDDSDIAELCNALVTEPRPTSENKPGRQVAAWIGNMVGKAASGVWDIGLEIAPKILLEAVQKYYGY